jgi:hypothetical protein
MASSEILSCSVCDKIFSSSQDLKNYLSSRKHLKKVEREDANAVPQLLANSTDIELNCAPSSSSLPLDTHPAIPPRNQENNFCFFCHFSCLSRADLVNHLGSAVHVTAHRSFQTAFRMGFEKGLLYAGFKYDKISALMFDPDFDFVHPPEELDDDSTWKGIPEYADELLILEDNLSDEDSEAGNSEIDDHE